MSHAKLEVRMESLLPFLQGTRTPYNMPVYPGAQCMIANSCFERSLETRFVLFTSTHNEDPPGGDWFLTC